MKDSKTWIVLAVIAVLVSTGYILTSATIRSTTESEVATLSSQVKKLKSENETLRQLVDQLNTRVSDLDHKLGDHTHKLDLSYTTLPSLGCDKCNGTMPVVIYNKLSGTYGPVFP